MARIYSMNSRAGGPLPTWIPPKFSQRFETLAAQKSHCKIAVTTAVASWLANIPLLLTPPLSSDVVDDELQDLDVEVKLSPDVVATSLPPEMLLNHGLWRWVSQPRWDVEQDDAIVGLLLIVAADEVYMLAHHLIVDAAAQLSLSLAIWMSASLSLSLCLLNLMMNDDPGWGLLMTIEVPVDKVDGDVVADDVSAAVVSSWWPCCRCCCCSCCPNDGRWCLWCPLGAQVTRCIEELVEDWWVMLVEPVAQPLTDVVVLNHADDAGDVHVLRRWRQVVVNDVRCLPWCLLHEGQDGCLSSHDDAVEDAPWCCWRNLLLVVRWLQLDVSCPPVVAAPNCWARWYHDEAVEVEDGVVGSVGQVWWIWWCCAGDVDEVVERTDGVVVRPWLLMLVLLKGTLTKHLMLLVEKMLLFGQADEVFLWWCCPCWPLRWPHVVDEVVEMFQHWRLHVEVDWCAVSQEEVAAEVAVVVEQWCWRCLMYVVVAKYEVDGELVELSDHAFLVDDKRLMLRKHWCCRWPSWCWHHCWQHGHVVVLLWLLLVVDEVDVVVLDVEVEQALHVVDQVLLDVVEVGTCWARCLRLCWFRKWPRKMEDERKEEDGRYHDGLCCPSSSSLWWLSSLLLSILFSFTFFFFHLPFLLLYRFLYLRLFLLLRCRCWHHGSSCKRELQQGPCIHQSKVIISSRSAGRHCCHHSSFQINSGTCFQQILAKFQPILADF